MSPFSNPPNMKPPSNSLTPPFHFFSVQTPRELIPLGPRSQYLFFSGFSLRQTFHKNSCSFLKVSNIVNIIVASLLPREKCQALYFTCQALFFIILKITQIKLFSQFFNYFLDMILGATQPAFLCRNVNILYIH